MTGTPCLLILLLIYVVPPTFSANFFLWCSFFLIFVHVFAGATSKGYEAQNESDKKQSNKR